MIIEKTRNKIQCYWETKPSGCCKPHCVFKHTKRQDGSNSTATDTAETQQIPATASGRNLCNFNKYIR